MKTTPTPARPEQVDPFDLLERARREDILLLRLVIGAALAVAAALSIVVALPGF